MKKLLRHIGIYILSLSVVIGIVPSRIGKIEADAYDIAQIVSQEYTYSYTGSQQVFTAPKNGVYIIELKGGAGGIAGHYNMQAITYRGGHGGLVRFNKELHAGDKLYIYVGTEGHTVNDGTPVAGNGTNSYGGNGNGYRSATGGGATEIRLNTDNRGGLLAVAGGGGGASQVSQGNGQNGGDAGTPESGNNGDSSGRGSSAYSYGGGGGGGYYGGGNGSESHPAMGGSNYTAGGLNIEFDGTASDYGAGYVTIKQFTDNRVIVDPNGGSYQGKTEKTVYAMNHNNTFTKEFYFKGIQNKFDAGVGGYAEGYTIPYTGYYYCELWGGNGGTDASSGGGGGYLKCYIHFEAGQNIVVGVGGKGGDNVQARWVWKYGDGRKGYGGWNCGGNPGSYDSTGDYSGGGGGATYIASGWPTVPQYNGTDLSEYYANKDLILAVAGGGSGGSASSIGYGGEVLYVGSADNYYVRAGADKVSLLSGEFAWGQMADWDGGGGGGGWIGGVAGRDEAGNPAGGGASYVNTSSGALCIGLVGSEHYGNGMARISYVSDMVTLDTPTREGYTFTGWTHTGDGHIEFNELAQKYVFTFGSGTSTLTANWTRNPVYSDLTINPNGGYYNNSKQVTTYTKYNGTTININNPILTGYKFTGWTKSGGGTLSGSSYTFGYQTTCTLTANWERIKSNLTVDPNGATLDGSTAVRSYNNREYGTVQAIGTPAKVGWKFQYWSELWGSDGFLTNDGWHFGNKNAYLKAILEPNTYSVNVYPNKPSNASSNISRLTTPSGYTWSTDHWSKTFTYDSTTIGYSPSQLFSLTGWMIDGTNYYSASNGTGTKYTSSSKNLTSTDNGTVNIYVKWTPIEYNIVYDKNKPTKASHDVTGTTASSHHVYDTAKTLTPNGYTLTGWRFNGWNTKANGTGTSYSNSASVKNLTTTNGGTVTLYAQWVQNTYTVNIYQNKPSNATNNIVRKITPSGYTWNTDHWSKTFTYDDTKIGYSPSQLFSLKGWTIDENNYYSANNGTGTTYNKDSSNLTSTHGGTVNLYVKWTANKYNLYYDKGLTTDTSTTTITDATRNTNIQKSGTDRPYTTATYDSDLTIAKIGGLVGRKYELNFNSNKPSSISKQKQNNSANPTSVSKITGNLPSKGQWQISGQDSDVTTNLTPAVGSKLTKPNYKDANNTSLVAIALWNNKVLNNFSSPTLEGWKFVGWYDNQSGANSTPVSNTTDMVKTVNATTNVSPNSNVTDTHNVTAFTVQPKTTEFNQTLYARWQRTITLTFNMNGGQYQGDEADVILTGIYYNNADGYNFSLTSTPTAAKTPEYEKQINQIDAYGTYDDNGENKKYTKYDITTGITYRFLGWSTNKNATEPETKYIVFSSSKVQTLRLYDNATLYAVWEPVLITTVEVNRTLGDLTFNDGTKPVNKSTPRRATDAVQTLGIIIKPGEQGSYTINSYGRTDRKAGVEFDSKIEDIYRNKGLWTDKLNPNIGTGEEYFESSGLTRIFNPATSHIMRKFYIPQYLGTSKSYASSIGVTVYRLEVAIWQDSYYYRYIEGENGVEAVLYPVYIYIVTDKPSSTPTNPTDPTPPSSEEAVISVLDELRTKLKIRLH